jgi:hypothetical protein
MAGDASPCRPPAARISPFCWSPRPSLEVGNPSGTTQNVPARACVSVRSLRGEVAEGMIFQGAQRIVHDAGRLESLRMTACRR